MLFHIQAPRAYSLLKPPISPVLFDLLARLPPTELHHAFSVGRQDQDSVVARRLVCIAIPKFEIIFQQDGDQGSFDHIGGKEATWAGVGAMAKFKAVGSRCNIS